MDPDESAEPDPRVRRPPGVRHPLLARLVSADSYGLILVLVVVTYLLAVSFPTNLGHSVLLAVQIATVWLTRT